MRTFRMCKEDTKNSYTSQQLSSSSHLPRLEDSKVNGKAHVGSNQHNWYVLLGSSNNKAPLNTTLNYFSQETMQQRLMELELQKGDIVTSYEQQLRDSDRALVEMQEAYKEKLRKCHAWEKVRVQAKQVCWKELTR